VEDPGCDANQEHPFVSEMDGQKKTKKKKNFYIATLRAFVQK